MTTHLSRFFRQRREARKLSFGDLARRLGYKNVTKGSNKVIKFERDGSVHPNLLSKLAAALGISPGEIRRCVKADRAESKARSRQPIPAPSNTQIVDVWRLRRLEQKLATEPGKENAYLNRALALRAENTELGLRIAIAKRLLKEPPFDLARQELEKAAVVKRLEALKGVLWNDLRKMPRLEWLCKKRKATTEAAQLRLAEKVLAEPETVFIGQLYSAWFKLYGIRSRRLKQTLNKLNLVKLRYFQAICREQNATTVQEQIRVAEEVLSWEGTYDGVIAGMGALARLKRAKPSPPPP